jgi:hypothetical protein
VEVGGARAWQAHDHDRRLDAFVENLELPADLLLRAQTCIEQLRQKLTREDCARMA